MDKVIKEQVVKEYLLGFTSHRLLAKKYGVGKSCVARWIQQYRGDAPVKREYLISPSMLKEVRDDLPTEVQELRRQLEEEKLRNKLLTAIIEIAEEELQVPIRKKSGTKPSAE